MNTTTKPPQPARVHRRVVREMSLANLLIDLEERLELQIRSLQRRVDRLEEELYETERLVERIEPLIQEGTVDQILKRVAIVRDVLIDCDGYRVSAEALESLIEEVEEALTKILNGEEPYGIMVG